MIFKEWQEKHGPNGGEYDIEMQRAGWDGAMTHSQSGDEVAWLVELNEDGGAKWAGFVDGKPEWTTDPNRALRFARKEDADNFKAFWCETAISTDHMWMSV